MKFICNGCAKWHNDTCILDVGEEQTVSGEHMRCPFNNAERDRHYCKWEEYEDGEVANLQPKVAKLPKLTAEVFDRPDCPEWVKYASVNKTGRVIFYADKTSPGVKADIGFYDASDWENSLIERHAKLPDWCKIGEWCYCLDDDGNGKYFKITKIKDNYIYGEDWDIDYHFVRQARLRPYNAEEMRGLVGKVVYTIEDKTFLVLAHSGNTVLFGDVLHTPEDLTLDIYKFPDGSPCGCLEHLENGEWVK